VLGGLIADGTIPLIAIGLIAIEVLVLFRIVRTRPGLDRRAILANAASGAALMLALRAALTDASPAAVGLWLGVSLLAHLADLAARWKS
jgi:hypothetical protein